MTPNDKTTPSTNNPAKPFPQSYWVAPGLLCAGQYPGDQDAEQQQSKLRGLVTSGIRRILNLMEETETGRGSKPFEPYVPLLAAIAAEYGLEVETQRVSIRDAGIPSRTDMKRILDIIDKSVAEQVPLYVHCWGGHGRTSTVIGCYLARQGMTGQAAIDQIIEWRQGLPKHHFPFEDAQEDFVRGWKAGE